MTDWLGGYSAGWDVYEVDRDTWQDVAAIGGVREVSVERDCSDDVPLLESGSMTIDAETPDFEGRWCRIYMVAEQGGRERVPMATLLFERASSHAERGVFQLSCNGRSVLQPVSDRKLPYGAYAPAGCDGAEYVGKLVAGCTPAPVVVEGSFTLVEDHVFDLGSSYLEAAWRVLGAAGWCMQVDGDGTVHVLAKPTVPALELSGANAGLLVPGVDDDYSIADVPNRYYAVNDSARAVATNEDPYSEAGYPRRGRWVDEVDTSPVLVDGESLEMYAARKLAERSTVLRKYSYEREFWPGVVPYSLVRAALPETGMEGDLRVVSQSLECGRGVVVRETAGAEVVA